ncbi:MAG: MFS transporter, partial [Alphaproteobacteria bacterium]
MLGKTVSKSSRGTATGAASTIGAAAVLAFGVALSIGVLEKSVAVICGALVVGGALWICAGLLFTTLEEEPGATEGGGNPLAVARDQMGLLCDDPQLVRFIATRGLLIATALAPPYMLALAGRGADKGSVGSLGPLVIAAAL